jgi:NitT/TauT family transport system substrate-binding protein
MSHVNGTRGARRGPALLAAAVACGLIVGIAGAAAAQSPSACPTPVPAVGLPSPEPGTFDMGTEPWLGYGPWWIAKEKDLFRQNGIDATVTSFDTDDLINAALFNGQIDGANIATHTALRLVADGTPITIVLLLDQSNAADAILAGPDIKSVADLKGKQVAYEEGTTSDILLRYALSQNGMTIDDIVKVPMPANQAGVAAIAGQVPVAVTYEPYLTAALQQNPEFKLIYTAGEKPGIVGDVFVVRNDYLAEHPGQVGALLRTWGDAVAAYDCDTAASQAIIEKAVGAEPGSLKTAFDGVDIYSLEEAKDLMVGKDPTTGGEYDATLTEVKNIATDAGILKKPVDETTLVDKSHISAFMP